MNPRLDTISVTDLREQTRRVIEDVHFRGRNYVVERAGQRMVVLVGIDEYEALLRAMESQERAPASESSASSAR